MIVLVMLGVVVAVIALVVRAARGGPHQVQGQAAAPAGRWATDPTRRHQLRWWDGARWSPSVSDDGALGHDPL